MNSFSRVLMAYTKQKSDRVPIYCGSVSSRIASHYLGHEAYVGGLSLAIPNASQLWYEAVVLQPDLVERYLEAQLTVALKNIPTIAASGARFVFGGGDCANNRGLNYSPKVFRELLVPRFRKISDECKKYGIYHTFGSDGRFWDVADDLYIETGIDGHYEQDVASEMSIRDVREKYPHITCIGGVSAATLESKPKDAIIAEVTASMTAAKELGGAIIGCSNLISPSTPIENVDLLLELLHKMR